MATSEDKRLQAKREADSAKNLAAAAKQRKANEEVTEATKPLSNSLKNLVEKMGSTDKQLQVTVAGLLANGKESFSSALAARKVTQAWKAINSDGEMQKQQGLKAQANAAIEASLEAQEKLLQDQNSAVVSARKSNVELARLLGEDKEIRDREQKLVDGGLDVVEARLITEKELGKNLEEIATKEQSIRDLSNSEIEKQVKITEGHTANLEKATDAENIRREKLNDDLVETSKSGGFDKFTGSIKTLTGGLIDIATPLDAATKQFNAMKDLGSSIADGFGKLKGATTGAFNSLVGGAENQEDANDSLVESTDESTKGMMKNAVIQSSIGGKLTKMLAGLTLGLVMVMAGILLPLIAIGAAFFLIKEALERFEFAGVGAGIKQGFKSIGTMLKSSGKLISSGMATVRKGLGLKPKNAVPKVTDPTKPKVQLRQPKGAIDPKTGKAIGGQFIKEGDGVIKEVAKVATKSSGFFGGLKALAKGVVKKLPIIGAAVETGMDGFDQFDKMGDLEEARKNGTLMKKDDKTGEEREYTDEEFEGLKSAFKANLAGSVGKGTGALAGATTGAAAGAALGSVVPVVGTFIGGILGAVIGGYLGGKAGDAIATGSAEMIMDGEGNSQKILDDAAASIKKVDPNSAKALADGQVNLDDQKQTATQVAMANTSNVISQDSNSTVIQSYSQKASDGGSTVNLLNPILT